MEHGLLLDHSVASPPRTFAIIHSHFGVTITLQSRSVLCCHAITIASHHGVPCWSRRLLSFGTGVRGDDSEHITHAHTHTHTHSLSFSVSISACLSVYPCDFVALRVSQCNEWHRIYQLGWAKRRTITRRPMNQSLSSVMHWPNYFMMSRCRLLRRVEVPPIISFHSFIHSSPMC